MRIDRMPFSFSNLFVCLALMLLILSGCTTTPGSSPQGSTASDVNASASNGSSNSIKEENVTVPRLPVADEPEKSNAPDTSVDEPDLASDAKKNPDEEQGSEALDDEKPNGGKQPGPSGDQPSVSVSPVPEKIDKVDSVVPPKNDDEKPNGGKQSDPSNDQPSVSVSPVPEKEDKVDSAVPPKNEKGSTGNVTVLPSEEAEAPGRKDEKLDAGGVAAGKTVAPEIDSPGQPTLPAAPGTPSALSGKPKADELQDTDATVQGVPSGLPHGNNFQPAGTTEEKDDSKIEPGDGDDSVIARPSTDIDPATSLVGTNGKVGNNEPKDEPETKLPIEPVENDVDPKSATHPSGPGVELPNLPVFPTEGRVDPKKSIELGDGEKLVPKERFRSGRYVILGDDPTEAGETGRTDREIELSTEDFRSISVPGNPVGSSAGKRIVLGNNEYVAPQPLPKRNSQFKSPERESALILRRPASGSENTLTRGGAEKSDERKFERLKELFAKRSANLDNETFSDSEKREFEKIRELVESKGSQESVVWR